MKESMVTRAAYERLVDRLGQLEAGVGAAEFQAGWFNEHSGYTDDEEGEHCESDFYPSECE